MKTMKRLTQTTELLTRLLVIKVLLRMFGQGAVAKAGNDICNSLNVDLTDDEINFIFFKFWYK